MKEKSSSGGGSSENNGSGPATTTTTTTTSSSSSSGNNTTSSSNTTTTTSSSSSSDTTTNILNSPYDQMNFMAPPVGGTVKCVTCLGNTVQGKVMAYDSQTRMLALRSPVPNKPGFFDYSMVNLAWCSNLELVEEATEPPEPMIHLNLAKLEKRKKINIDNKYKEINSLGNDVSSLAQNLYFTIYKTLNEVEWDGKSIVVMKSVVISPPYDVTSCSSRNSDNVHALEHVKKIVKKFNEEFNHESQQQASGGGTSVSQESSK